MTLPKGVTKRYVARLFKGGMSMFNIAKLYDCYVDDIEQIVREVMAREEKK